MLYSSAQHSAAWQKDATDERPMKMIAGWFSWATLNSILTSFSPSPCHLLVKVAAEMLKKVAFASWAKAFASMVLPLPGGPYRRSPRAGALRPWKRSALWVGKMTISWRACTDIGDICIWKGQVVCRDHLHTTIASLDNDPNMS